MVLPAVTLRPNPVRGVGSCPSVDAGADAALGWGALGLGACVYLGMECDDGGSADVVFLESGNPEIWIFEFLRFFYPSVVSRPVSQPVSQIDSQHGAQTGCSLVMALSPQD